MICIYIYTYIYIWPRANTICEFSDTGTPVRWTRAGPTVPLPKALPLLMRPRAVDPCCGLLLAPGGLRPPFGLLARAAPVRRNRFRPAGRLADYNNHMVLDPVRRPVRCIYIYIYMGSGGCILDPARRPVRRIYIYNVLYQFSNMVGQPSCNFPRLSFGTGPYK